MLRIVRVGVAVAVLFAVATVLIAPTIDMPETTLREHSITSYASGGHVPGSLLASYGAGPSHLSTYAIAAYVSVSPRLWNFARVPSHVLRC
jgi:hypothetical protein